MFRTICSTFPFIVSVCWFVTFLLNTRSNDRAKRVLTVFLGTCTVLYICHAFYFNAGLPLWGESLWALCSLSVYPLYYIYITHLTCRPLSNAKTMLCLLPGIMVAMAILIFPDSGADNVRKIINGIQILLVAYYGYKHLTAFDKEIAEVYSDTEGRETSAVRTLLVAIVAISLLSTAANVIGKQYVAASEWLVVMLVPFGILIFSLSFIGYTRKFSREQYIEDTCELSEGVTTEESAEDADNELSKKIAELIEKEFYLVKNLKINDVARETGVCRTYVSNYINKNYNCSFSDYINKMRVEYAKRLMAEKKDIKMTVVSDMSGFSSEQSFYRNFRKFTGKTPAEWK